MARGKKKFALIWCLVSRKTGVIPLSYISNKKHHHVDAITNLKWESYKTKEKTRETAKILAIGDNESELHKMMVTDHGTLHDSRSQIFSEETLKQKNQMKLVATIKRSNKKREDVNIGRDLPIFPRSNSDLSESLHNQSTHMPSPYNHQLLGPSSQTNAAQSVRCVIPQQKETLLQSASNSILAQGSGTKPSNSILAQESPAKSWNATAAERSAVTSSNSILAQGSAANPSNSKSAQGSAAKPSNSISVQGSAAKPSDSILAQESAAKSWNSISAEGSAAKLSNSIFAQGSAAKPSNSKLAQGSAAKPSNSISVQRSAAMPSYSILAQESAAKSWNSISAEGSAAKLSNSIFAQGSAAKPSNSKSAQRSVAKPSNPISAQGSAAKQAQFGAYQQTSYASQFKVFTDEEGSDSIFPETSHTQSSNSRHRTQLSTYGPASHSSHFRFSTNLQQDNTALLSTTYPTSLDLVDRTKPSPHGLASYSLNTNFSADEKQGKRILLQRSRSPSESSAASCTAQSSNQLSESSHRHSDEDKGSLVSNEPSNLREPLSYKLNLGRVTKRDIEFQELLLKAIKETYAQQTRSDASWKENLPVQDCYLLPGNDRAEISPNCGFYLPKNIIRNIEFKSTMNNDWKILVRETLLEVYGNSIANYSANGKRGNRPAIDFQFKGIQDWVARTATHIPTKKILLNLLIKWPRTKEKSTRKNQKQQQPSTSNLNTKNVGGKRNDQPPTITKSADGHAPSMDSSLDMGMMNSPIMDGTQSIPMIEVPLAHDQHREWSELSEIGDTVTTADGVLIYDF